MIWYDMVSIYRLFGNTQTKYGINLLSFFFFFWTLAASFSHLLRLMTVNVLAYICTGQSKHIQ